MHHTHSDGYIDLYKANDAALAERAVRLLHREGIEAVCRPVASDLFPTSVGLDNAHVVAVGRRASRCGTNVPAPRRRGWRDSRRRYLLTCLAKRALEAL